MGDKNKDHDLKEQAWLYLEEESCRKGNSRYKGPGTGSSWLIQGTPMKFMLLEQSE